MAWLAQHLACCRDAKPFHGARWREARFVQVAHGGTPETAPPAILDRARAAVADITRQREATARGFAARLGVPLPWPTP